MQKNFLLTLLFFVFTIQLWPQNPLNCFEIESILVDACSSPEGYNEMFMIHIGSSALNVSAMDVNFPNNSYTGICQNASTAQSVAALNRQIQGCGWFLEPTGGVLPAAARVLFICSEIFDTLGHDFSAVNDTIYVIFQCTGSSNAHFLNAASVSSPRTLEVRFNPPAGCGDTVTYDAMFLVDTSGITGPAQPTGARNGATAVFAWDGSASYVNHGCRPPLIPLNPDAGPPAAGLCEGQTLSLNGALSGGNYPFFWSGGLGTFNTNLTLNTTYSPAPGETGNFYIYLSEHSSCDTVFDSILVSIYPSPALNLGPDTILCGSSIFLLDAGPGTVSYLWSTGATSQSISIVNSGLYFVMISDGTCTATDSILVTLGSPLVVNLGNDFTICQGNPVILDAGPAPQQFLWSTGDTTRTIQVSSPGIYSVTAWNSCTADSDTVQLFLYPVASVFSGNDTTLCEGDTLYLMYANISAGTPGWSAGTGGTFSNPLSLNNSFIPSIDSGNVILILSLSDSCGTYSDSLTLTVSPAPDGTLSGRDTLCFGDSLFLTYSGNATDIFWYGGTGTFSFPDQFSTTYFPGAVESGILTLYAATTNSCGTKTDSLFIWITDSLAADFIWNPSEIFPGTTVDFNALNSTPGSSFYWTFGDSAGSQIEAPRHYYLSPGTYPVTLYIQDGTYCLDEMTHPVIVIPADITLPNIFSPNGDGINDLLFFEMPPLLSYKLTITDRWGIPVFETNDISRPWDGKMNENDCQEGVYYFIVMGVPVVGGMIHKVGNVALVR